MRSRVSLFALLFVVGSFVFPHVAQAGGVPFFGPIIPAAYNVCPASWGLLVDVINNIISLLITLAIVFVAPLMIAYSGFLLVVNQGDAGTISKAKSTLTNTIVGIVIALAAWMIVDAVMAVLYNPSAAGGTWSSLISSGGINACLPQAGALPGAGFNQAPVTGISASGGSVTPVGKVLPQCSSGNPACSPAALQSTGLTATQANVMSCIAVTESSGNPGTPPYNVTHPGSNSTACGTFQITKTTWNKNAPSSCANFSTNCMNATCNMQVAQILVSKNGYSDWTCKNCNSKATSCIAQYGQ
ncbi:MAG: hypothetical protein ACYCZZ_01275 [Minisyncoccota bacterium]